MSINSIMWSAQSALATSQTALQTTSTNVANVNNPDYVRRQVQLQALDIAGQTVGVQVAQIQRVAADFLQGQVLSSRSTSGTFDAMSSIHDQLQSLLGAPDSADSMPGQISQALAYASQLTLDPVSPPNRAGYLQQLQSALGSISNLSSQVQQLRAQTDSSLSTQVASANSLISDLFDLNNQIVKAQGSGQSADALQDQQAADLRKLSDLMSIKTLNQPDGAVYVTTDDGFALVTDNKVQLSYTASVATGTDVVYAPITAQSVNANTGQPVGSAVDFDGHISQGSMRGLLTMRDTDLPNLMQQLGELGANFADQLNAAHNDSVAVPPLNTLQGRNTGLLSTDDAGLTGTTTLAVVGSDGTLVKRIDIDFDGNSYSVNGGPPTSFAGTTIQDVVDGINTALGADGSASFANGQLTIAASNPSDGIGFAQPDTNGSSRGGQSFSQFFGLNDLVQAAAPSNFNTGLTSAMAAAAPAGFTAGQEFNLVMRDPSGKIVKEFNYTATGSESLGDIINAINDPASGLGAYATFGLDSNGQLVATPTTGNENNVLDVAGDTTDRGGTGVSFTALFGLGRRYQMDQAQNLQVAPSILQQPANLALAHLDIDGTTAVGDVVATQGDSQGAEALASLATKTVGFGAAGDLRSVASTIGDYASLILSNVSSRAASVDQLDSAANSVKTEVENRRTSTEGVNLDEELSNMIVYQQAYNAAARLVTVAKDLYDTLLQIVS